MITLVEDEFELAKILAIRLEVGRVGIVIDARKPGVRVPPEHAQNPELRLNLSRRFEGIDLRFSENAVDAMLTFAGVPFRCCVPYASIMAVSPPSDWTTKTERAAVVPKQRHLRLLN